jgi:nitrogen fixation protein FixH
VKRAWTWPVVVVVILALTVGGNIWVAVIASADPSFAIEPDYYKRAVGFDLEQARARRSDRLGWTVAITASTTSSAGTTVTAVLVDSVGTPVTDANVRVQLRRVARSQSSIPADLVFDGASYRAVVPVQVGGLWDVALEARRGPSRFAAQRRLDLGS